MKQKPISLSSLSYEIRNITGNPFVHIFGIALPIFLTILISKAATSDMNDPSAISLASTSIFLGIGFIIPMATILMGYSCTYSQEVEKGIALRMTLFGFNQKYVMINRLIAEFIFMTIAFLIYATAGYIVLDLKLPTVSGALIYLLCLYAYSAIMFLLAHSIAGMIGKFGLTYAVTMSLYFAMMIFGGSMGITYDKMPEAMQAVARLLPNNYITQDAYTIWIGDSYRFVPMIQSYVLLAAIAGILLFLSVYRSKRKIH